MSLTVIDLNDTNIRVGKGEQILFNSPGYAVIKDDKIAFGTQAAKLNRIYPRSTHDDFWYRFSQDAIQSSSNQIRHNADLAYMQLAEIYEQSGGSEKWLIAIPASFNQEQLALLLGLLKAANYADVQLIDSALLASINSLNKGEHLHLDMQLHQSVLTSLETDDKHRVITSNVLPETGLLGIYEQCAKLISNEFINQSRFDPHHHAESEQLLFENIPICLSKLTTSSMSKLDLEYQGSSYSANITREAIIETLSPIYDNFYKHIEESKQLLLSHRFRILPGFMDRLSNARLLDEFAVFTSAKKYLTLLNDADSNANYLSELPAIEGTEELTIPHTESRQATDITHILIDNIAYKLNEKGCYIASNNKIETSLSLNTQFSIQSYNGHYSIQAENHSQVSLNNVTVNDKQLLTLGDSIKIAGSETSSTVIKVS
ncbi:MAG: hypothetical protein ACI85N_001899 [Gammaproteobacteria bacterium]|jgi:hypothetical protein